MAGAPLSCQFIWPRPFTSHFIISVCAQRHTSILQTKPGGLSAWCRVLMKQQMLLPTGTGDPPWRPDSAAWKSVRALCCWLQGVMREEVSLCICIYAVWPGCCTISEVLVLKYREMAASRQSIFADYFSVCVLQCYPHVILHLKGWVYSFQEQHLLLRCWSILTADIVQREPSKGLKQSSYWNQSSPCPFIHFQWKKHMPAALQNM